MKATNFSSAEYLARIGFCGEAKADFSTVAAVMQAQLFSVPFENLDIQAGKIVSLVPEHIVDKIVRRRRGGYCYEVNGLFAMALEALGISYRFVAARPMYYPVRRPKTHMALVVSVSQGEWLCDLGFGSYGIRAPLSLDATGRPVVQGSDQFLLSRNADGEYVLKARVKGEWVKQYSFHLHAQEWIDFTPANYLNSTHPEAIFVQRPLVVLHNQNGRKILFGNSLKLVSQGREEEVQIPSEDYPVVLHRHFGLPSIEQIKAEKV